MAIEDIRQSGAYKALPSSEAELNTRSRSGEFNEVAMLDHIDVKVDFTAHVWLMDNWKWFSQYVNKLIGKEVPNDGKGEEKTPFILIILPKWATISYKFLLVTKDNPVYDFFMDIFYGLPRATKDEIVVYEKQRKLLQSNVSETLH